MTNLQTSGYFDWAATAVPDETILNESLSLSLEAFANPSSIHRMGTKAHELLLKARERCSVVLEVKPQTLIFTSGGTEANHLPILSLLQRPAKGSIVVSAIEHPAVREQIHMMKNCGWTVIPVPPDIDGIIKPQAIIRKLQSDTALVCVMAVNNETGAMQPIYEIADNLIKNSAGKKKPLFHVDAVQAVGKVLLNLSHIGIDSAAMSAHKLCGPRGIGLLYYARRHEPFIRGGEQEGGLRPGTENLFGALAFASCLEKYASHKVITKKMADADALMYYFTSRLKEISGCSIIPSCRTAIPEHNGEISRNYSPWIVQVAFEKLPGNVLVRALSEQGFYISTGSACSSRKINRPVLESMQVSKEQASNAVRFSFGYTTKKEDIDELLMQLIMIKKMF